MEPFLELDKAEQLFSGQPAGEHVFYNSAGWRKSVPFLVNCRHIELVIPSESDKNISTLVMTSGTQIHVWFPDGYKHLGALVERWKCRW
jgi:hypothetical protein